MERKGMGLLLRREGEGEHFLLIALQEEARIAPLTHRYDKTITILLSIGNYLFSGVGNNIINRKNYYLE